MAGTGYMAICYMCFLFTWRNSTIHPPPQGFLHPVSCNLCQMIELQCSWHWCIWCLTHNDSKCRTAWFSFSHVHCCLSFMKIVCVINKLTYPLYLIYLTLQALRVVNSFCDSVQFSLGQFTQITQNHIFPLTPKVVSIHAHGNLLKIITSQ